MKHEPNARTILSFFFFLFAYLYGLNILHVFDGLICVL